MKKVEIVILFLTNIEVGQVNSQSDEVFNNVVSSRSTFKSDVYK